MRFHQNFIISFLLFVLLFALFELKEVLLFQTANGWVINETAMGGVYNCDLVFDSTLSKTDHWPIWLRILSKLILSAMASTMITRVAIKNLIFDERSYFPMILFPTLFLGLYTGAGTIKMLVVIILQIWLFSLLFRGFKRTSSIVEYFYAGIITAASTIIYPQSVVSLVTMLLSVVLLNRGVREFVCCVIGFLFPLFLYSYIGWISGGAFMEHLDKLWNLLINPTTEHLSAWVDTSNRLGISVLIISLLPIVIASVVSVASLRISLRYARRRQRKFLNLLVFQLLVVTLFALLIPATPQTLLLNTIPLAVIMSYYFNLNHSRFAKTIFWLIPIGVLIYNVTLIYQLG